jgi:hypothetical protein
MNDNPLDERRSEQRRFRHYQGGLFFPLIIIAVGVVFLLNNLGLIQGNLWDNLVNLWPLILVAIGLDSIFKREGVVGPAFVIGLGLIFLLANLGYLAVNVWDAVIRLWPLLLIAIGLDIVIGRRSLVGSLLGVAILIALLVAGLSLFGLVGGSGEVLAGEQINQPLAEVTSARLEIEPAVGSVRLQALSEPTGLVVGTVRAAGPEKVRQDYSVSGGRASFALTGSGGVFFGSRQRETWSWDLALSAQIPLELKLSQGAGNALYDLRGLQVSALDVSQGLGQVTVILPESGKFKGRVSSAIGRTVIQVAPGVGLRLHASTGLGNLAAPPEFTRQGDDYLSPGYASADSQIELDVSQAIGQIEVRFASGR